jgi:hypothetical protein
MPIQRSGSPIPTDGEAGTAVGHDHIPTDGAAAVLSVRVEYSPGQAAGTVVTITDASSGAPVLAVTGNTNRTYNVRAAASKPDGSGSMLTEVKPVVDGIDIDVSAANPGAISATVIFDPEDRR